MLNRVVTWVRCHAEVVGFAILALGVAGAFYAVKVSFDNTSVRDNKTRCSIVGVVYTLSHNSRNTLNATIASPTATRAQKTVAAANLNRINGQLLITYNVLGHPHGSLCPRP
jgi:uncharacterized membrane protein